MTNQFHPVGAPSGQKENSHFIAIVAAPKDNVDDGREGEFTVCNVNDAWQELDDETFQLYPGGARNYYYRSEGRVMNHRSLNMVQLRLVPKRDRSSQLHKPYAGKPGDLVGLDRPCSGNIEENYGRVSCIPQSKWERGKRAFPGPGILQAYFLYRVSQSQRFFLPLDLTYHELLSLTREFGCKYKHDKIYTTCGIPTLDSISSAIVPDYSKAVHTVYQEIALLFIQTNHSVAFLADVRNPHGWYHMKPGMTSKAPLELQGPSWVPRWHYQLTEKIAPLQNCFAFSAATKVRPKLQVSNDGSKIAILGVIVDTVKSAIENRSVGTYWRGEEVRDSFFPELLPLALTLTCGKNWDGAPVSDMEMHVADYARCLLRGGLLWSLACASKPFAMGQDDSAAQQNLHTGDVITAQALEVMSRGGNADRFLDAAATMGDGRAHFLTTGNQFGIGPDSTYPGDILCVLYGLGVPCIIRPRAETGCYILLGECYVEEIMHGEVITSLASNSGGVLKESWIQLE
ncbi:hypothetical protein TrVFT333_007910 [Trichoderma virens FT-333]|nr:hypothetical protein TrVFT333_007910 [Trichoderma virens FT-333]